MSLINIEIMRTNVIFSDRKIFHTDNNGTICHLTVTMPIKKELLDLLKVTPGFIGLCRKLNMEVYNDKVVFYTYGSTRLHPEDEYDKERGEYIADTKAQRTGYIMARNFNAYVADLMDKNYYWDMFKMFDEGCKHAYYVCDDHVEKLANNYKNK